MCTPNQKKTLREMMRKFYGN